MERKRVMGSASVCKNGRERERERETYWCLLLHRETAPALFSRVLFLTTAPLGPRCPCQLVPLTSQTNRDSNSERERDSHLVSVIDKKNPSLSYETGTPILKNSYFFFLVSKKKQSLYHVQKPTLVHAFSRLVTFKFSESSPYLRECLRQSSIGAFYLNA